MVPCPHGPGGVNRPNGLTLKEPPSPGPANPASPPRHLEPPVTTTLNPAPAIDTATDLGATNDDIIATFNALGARR